MDSGTLTVKNSNTDEGSYITMDREEVASLILEELSRYERETSHLRNGSNLKWTKELASTIIAKWMERIGLNSAI